MIIGQVFCSVMFSSFLEAPDKKLKVEEEALLIDTTEMKGGGNW